MADIPQDPNHPPDEDEQQEVVLIDPLVQHIDEASEHLVHHLEDSMHELEERRRQLTGEDPPPTAEQEQTP